MTITASPSIEMPLYNADIQAQGFPAACTAFADAVRAADGVIVVSAGIQFHHSRPAEKPVRLAVAMKEQPFVNKPVAVQSASQGPVGGARMQYDFRKMMVYLDAITLNKPEDLRRHGADQVRREDRGTEGRADHAKFPQQQLEAFEKFIARARAGSKRWSRCRTKIEDPASPCILVAKKTIVIGRNNRWRKPMDAAAATACQRATARRPRSTRAARTQRARLLREDFPARHDPAVGGAQGPRHQGAEDRLRARDLAFRRGEAAGRGSRRCSPRRKPSAACWCSKIRRCAGQSKITNSLYAGLQLILPGEIAARTATRPSAIRLILDGEGAYTQVDGEKTIMKYGDFVLTPNWTAHDHGNESKCR
jgi:NAD(P)H-dependent FMN reductase